MAKKKTAVQKRAHRRVEKLRADQEHALETGQTGHDKEGQKRLRRQIKGVKRRQGARRK